MSEGITRIQDYIDRLAQELEGSDPAVIMDASNDAREYLHSEIITIMEGEPDIGYEAALRAAVKKFGSPDEVARSFLEMETQVNRAFSLTPPESRRRGFFEIVKDPRAYASFLYMLLSTILAVVHLFLIGYGVPLALLSCFFIVGVPICLLFFASLRALALVEFRIIESLLGERMPRRPVFLKSEGNMLTRFKITVKDPYTWKTLLYHFLMIPMGAIYGAITLAGLGLVFELLILPVAPKWSDIAMFIFGTADAVPGAWAYIVTVPLAFLMLACILHMMFLLGRLHARFIKVLMVGRTVSAADSDEGSI